MYKAMSENNSVRLLEQITKKTRIKEKKRGIIKILAAFDRFPDRPIKFISQQSEIPIPLCSAIRKEFIKNGLCSRTPKGTILTVKGKKLLSLIGGYNKDFSCLKCEGLGIDINLNEFQKELNILEKFCSMRGLPNTLIDQSFATPETALRRVLFMSHKYDLSFGDFALIGDSDLTSIALSLFLGSKQKIVVFDIDEKVEHIINEANKELKKTIHFVHHDLREPIPQKYRGKFNVIHTDPPYTRTGITLFISRALELINAEEGGIIYLSTVRKPPEEMLNIEKDLLNMNCLITDILPRFNKYIGAQKIAGESALYRLQAILPTRPLINEIFEGDIYTGEQKKTIRIYRCINCNNTIKVGTDYKYKTIEQLKTEGCPFCHHKKFKRETTQ